MLVNTPDAVVLLGGGRPAAAGCAALLMVNKVRLYGRQHNRAATFAFLAASFLYEGTGGIGGAQLARPPWRCFVLRDVRRAAVLRLVLAVCQSRFSSGCLTALHLGTMALAVVFFRAQSIATIALSRRDTGLTKVAARPRSRRSTPPSER
jgi:hypothetical protein